MALRHVFKVTGKGLFPMDMLRIDKAFPVVPYERFSPANFFMKYTVTLATDKPGGPAKSEWGKYGFKCEVIDTFKSPEKGLSQ